jgi:hypothetical protein
VYTLDAEEAEKSKDLVQGTGQINGKHVNILFDSGATHSFISSACVKRVYFPVTKLSYEVLVTTPSEEKLSTTSMCSPVFLKYQGKTFCLSLYCLPMKGLDVILGMDWLRAHKVTIDCANKTVHVPDRDYEVYYTHRPTFDLDNLAEFDDGPSFIILCISDAKFHSNIDSIWVVKDFPEVFPKDIKSLPPEREVEFSIELVPGAGPMSKAPYRMTPLELAEVKKQVE